MTRQTTWEVLQKYAEKLEYIYDQHTGASAGSFSDVLRDFWNDIERERERRLPKSEIINRIARYLCEHDTNLVFSSLAPQDQDYWRKRAYEFWNEINVPR